MSKKKIKWLILLIGIIALIVLTVYFRQKESVAICTDVEIELTTDENRSFVTEGELADYLLEHIGEIKGLNMNKISLKEIEKTIESHPHVYSTEVFTNLEHKIIIKANLHQPLVRVHPYNADGYYISTTGHHFPLSPHYTERVVVVTGFVDTLMSKKVYTLATHVNRLPFWKAQIEQIFVGEEGDLILIEKFGDHRLIIGDTENLDEKLERIKVFYEKALKPKGWEHFTTINAKYNNQVICK